MSSSLNEKKKGKMRWEKDIKKCKQVRNETRGMMSMPYERRVDDSEGAGSGVCEERGRT